MIRLNFRTTKTGVPIIKDAEIEVHAEKLLADYNPKLLAEPQPLDVDDFAENYLGLNTHYENLSHNGSILGMMVYNNRKIPVYEPRLNRAEYCPIDANTIVVDNSLLKETSEVLYRSTAPHECGHSIYHRNFYEENDNQLSLLGGEATEKVAIAVCRKKDIVGGFQKRRLVTDHDFIEHHAKYFSAAVLMNRPAMRILCDKYRSWISNTTFGSDNRKEEMLVLLVAETFFVSPASARIRIKQLDLGFKLPQEKRELAFIGEISSL